MDEALKTIIPALLWAIGILLSTVIGLGCWFIIQMFTNIKSLSNDTKGLTSAVNVLINRLENVEDQVNINTSDIKDNREDIIDVRLQIATGPRVRHVK